MNKQLAINISLAIGSLTAFLLTIEFGLRITGLQTTKPNPPKIYQQSDNPSISYELKPNLNKEPAYRATVSTDEHGFRLHSSLYTLHSTLPTLVLLGDSITFGHGVHDDETLAAYMENLLGTPVINAGVPGYTLKQEIATYNEKLRSREPESVMIVFFWNDLDGEEPGILDADGILRPADWQPAPITCNPIQSGILGMVPGKCWLDTHSALYKALKKLVTMRSGNEMLEETREQSQKGEVKDPATPESVDAYLAELAPFTATLPAEKYFVIWPDRYLHPETKPMLIAGAEQLGFTVIDLYERFGNEAKTLVWDTVHPHAETLEDAAEYIVDQL